MKLHFQPSVDVGRQGSWKQEVRPHMTVRWFGSRDRRFTEKAELKNGRVDILASNSDFFRLSARPFRHRKLHGSNSIFALVHRKVKLVFCTCGTLTLGDMALASC